MSLSTRIAPHLPYLRRFSRAGTHIEACRQRFAGDGIHQIRIRDMQIGKDAAHRVDGFGGRKRSGLASARVQERMDRGPYVGWDVVGGIGADGDVLTFWWLVWINESNAQTFLHIGLTAILSQSRLVRANAFVEISQLVEEFPDEPLVRSALETMTFPA